MHEYYRKNLKKIIKIGNALLTPIKAELEQATKKPFAEIQTEIWDYYEREFAEYFPYIGGNAASGTKNLTGAYVFVAMGKVLERYGVELREIGRLMALSYERFFKSMPVIVRFAMRKIFSNPKLLQKISLKKDRQNAENAKKNPGSFETKTQVPPERGYDFCFHFLVCPLANFAKERGCTDYMPYLCNLDYAMFAVMGVPLRREHTYAADGDYCDFKFKIGDTVLACWPPVFEQGKGYK